MKLPATIRKVKKLVGFVSSIRIFSPSLAQKLMPWFKLLRKDADFFPE